MAIQTGTLDRAGHAGWSAWRLKDPTFPVWIGAAVLLVFLMLLPLGAIFRTSLWDEKGFTLTRYLEVFTNASFLKAIWNTLIISTWVGAISVAIGGLLAWLVTRTDLPWKKPIRALVMASFVTPPFLGAFAWTLLAGPNAGSLNKLYRAITGTEEALFNIFTMSGLIFVMALYSFPYVFSMIASVCELISSDLEDAAEILGANKWRIAWTVTLPLALPALIGGFILAFLHTDMGAVSVSAAPRHGGGVFGATAAGDDGTDRRAEKNSRAQGLQHRGRQGCAKALDPARLEPDSRAALRARHSLPFGFLALLDFAQGGALASLGDAAHVG